MYAYYMRICQFSFCRSTLLAIGQANTGKARRLSEIYTMAGHLVRRLNQISVAVFADRMALLGVELTPVQFGALSAIEATPGIDQASLAGAIAYDKATIGGVVDRLENKGYIRRKTSHTDRRARVLSVTAKGQALLKTIRPEVADLQNDILSGLDAGERAQFLALLRKTTDAGNALSRAPLRKSTAKHQAETSEKTDDV